MSKHTLAGLTLSLGMLFASSGLQAGAAPEERQAQHPATTLLQKIQTSQEKATYGWRGADDAIDALGKTLQRIKNADMIKTDPAQALDAVEQGLFVDLEDNRGKINDFKTLVQSVAEAGHKKFPGEIHKAFHDLYRDSPKVVAVTNSKFNSLIDNVLDDSKRILKELGIEDKDGKIAEGLLKSAEKLSQEVSKKFGPKIVPATVDSPEAAP